MFARATWGNNVEGRREEDGRSTQKATGAEEGREERAATNTRAGTKAWGP